MRPGPGAGRARTQVQGVLSRCTGHPAQDSCPRRQMGEAGRSQYSYLHLPGPTCSLPEKYPRAQRVLSRFHFSGMLPSSFLRYVPLFTLGVWHKWRAFWVAGGGRALIPDFQGVYTQTVVWWPSRLCCQMHRAGFLSRGSIASRGGFWVSLTLMMMMIIFFL